MDSFTPFPPWILYCDEEWASEGQRKKREGELEYVLSWVSACGYTPFQAAPYSLILRSRNYASPAATDLEYKGSPLLLLIFLNPASSFAKIKKYSANLNVLSTSWNPN